jgi:hypothetical protein
LANTQKELYSIGSNYIWEHSDLKNPGNFYDKLYNFEFEFIDNNDLAVSKIFSTVRYWAGVFDYNNNYVKELNRHINPGFTSFYVYNSNQISLQTNINYLSNSRLVDKFWYVNDFRDMSKMLNNTSSDLITELPNVQNEFMTYVSTPSNVESMFVEEGIPNDNYIDLNKHWFNQKRFVDHYLGVRLVNDNSNKNLVYLYAAGTKYRQSFR